MEYGDSVYRTADPIPYQPAEKTAATWVDTYEGVLEMLEELKEASEIAVDLEHHDFRTYVGLVSLMQISTRHKDWIVDTLKPWRRQLEALNEVFANPNIIKVSSCLPLGSQCILTSSGVSWCIHGHHMAPERSGFICQRSFRYLLCLRSSLPSQEFSISSQTIC
jgi:hypothetical protein